MNAQLKPVGDWTEVGWEREAATASALTGALRNARPHAGLTSVCEALVEERPGTVAAVVRWKGRARCVAAASSGPWNSQLPGRILSRSSVFWRELQSRRAVHQGPVHAVPLFMDGKLHGALVLAGTESPPSCFPLAAGIAETLLEREELAKTLRATRLALLRARGQARRLRDVEQKQRLRAAHDLRAPLTALMGYLDMLKRGLGGPLSPGVSRYVERMTQAVARERTLIDEQVCPPIPLEENGLESAR